MYEGRVVLIFTLISFTSTSVVKWVPNTSFNVPIHFKDGKLPCSKQTVVFPDRILESIRIEAEVAASEIILPIEGELLIDGAIELGADLSDTNCTDDGNSYFIDKVMAWNQPDVWFSTKFNKATPDAERVPCYDDVVEFPKDSQFTIRLPDFTQTISELRVDGENLDTRQFLDRILSQTDQTQQFVLNDVQSSGVKVEQKQCGSPSGCACQRRMLDIDCSAKFCPVPTCSDPVKPVGHCCKICGGYINFDVDNTFDIMSFQELVQSIADEYGQDNIVYHIGRLPDHVQVVVVDKDEYSGVSAQVINEVNYNFKPHWASSLKDIRISGSPLSKSGLGGKIFVSVFFVVIFVMGAVYLYYYRLPDVRIPILERGSRGMLSRFQRRTDSVVSLTRRDSATPSVVMGSGFKNPLYSSKRGRVVVTETDADAEEAEE